VRFKALLARVVVGRGQLIAGLRIFSCAAGSIATVPNLSTFDFILEGRDIKMHTVDQLGKRIAKFAQVSSARRAVPSVPDWKQALSILLSVSITVASARTVVRKNSPNQSRRSKRRLPSRARATRQSITR
jgi:hypothetical protein